MSEPAVARARLPLMALVRQRRLRHSRRQDLWVVILSALVALAETGALLVEQRQHPRPKRQPIAVALVSTPLNRRPPTPELRPPPPPPAPAPTPPRAPSPAAASSDRPAGAQPPRPVPPAPDGKSPPAPPEAAGPGTDGAPTPTPPPPVPAPEPGPLAEPAPAVPPAGGRRQCAHDGPGAPITTSSTTPAGAVPAIPALLIAPFRTRPGLDRYLAGVEYLGRSGPRALGTHRLALPEEVIRVELDEPGGAAIYIGRTDARCAVVAVLKGNPLLLRLRGVPVRLVDRARRVASAIVDLEMDAQANLSIVRRAGDPLPFTRARLANAGVIAASIGGHLATAPRR